MSHDLIAQPVDSPPGSTRHVDLYIVVVVVMAALFTALTTAIELSAHGRRADWTLFAVFAVLLLASEVTSASWLRFGNAGVVTLSWSFAFALVLLGSPSAAVGATAVATLIAEIRSGNGVRKTLFNTAQVSLALAFGGLTLFAFGVHGPIAQDGSIPLMSGLGMIASGTVVFVSNGVVLCYLLAALESRSFMAMMRDGFALSMSADGALLALAPIFVIATGYSLLLIPLLGVAAFLVYHTARESLKREHEANHDTLTSLRNRRSLSDEIDRFLVSCRENGVTGGVLLLDLDGFKNVNDRLGHHVGDELLRAFAARLVDSVPTSAVTARLGGDEFAVLLHDIDVAQCVAMVQRLRSALNAPITLEGYPLAVSASIGIALCPDHGEDSIELLTAADVAMYRAKHLRTGVELYGSSVPTRGRGRRSLLGDLHLAIGTDALSVVYQPQVHMRDGSLLAVEGLLRWDHGTAGIVPPDDFVGLAEQTELIGPLTDFVIECAVRDIVGLGDQHLALAVNVSSRNLQDRHFAATTLSTLDRLGFDPARLELEITERALTSDLQRTQATLDELRAVGIRVSIDDFGTGYSSFLTVRELQVDRLKIDKTFVLGLSASNVDRVVVQSVIALAHGLGIEVVGEGIESQEAWDSLVELGCDLAQGYFIAHPMVVDDLATWIADRKRQRHPGLLT
jgi:diguanylate cyclase (GGDEF)-like protein